jgi:hypothetical protein
METTVRRRTGIVLSAALAAITVVSVQQQLTDIERGDRPDAVSKFPVAEVDNVYRFQRRPVVPPGVAQGVDPAPERRLLACDPGSPAGWTRVHHRPGTTVAGHDESRIGDLRRADGISQLTIDGCPVYRRPDGTRRGANPIHDTAGTWFVVTPDAWITRPRWT